MSDPIDTLEYLSASFDAQNLKVAELRRIFFEHNVEFKSGAKKADLVQIFNEEIKPQAAVLLRDRLNPAPSANRIETVGAVSPVPLPLASPAKTPGKRGRPRKHPLPEEEETTDVEVTVPPPSTAKRGPGRPRKAPKVEDDGQPTSPKKASGRRQTVDVRASADEDKEMIEEGSETSPPPPSTVTKSRKSTAKAENREPRFSSDNPFQSGSSPIAPQVSPTKRRQTVVPNSATKLAPPLAKEPRRKTEGILVPQSLSSPAGSSEVEFKFSKTNAVRTPVAASAFRKSERFMPPIDQIKASPAFQSAAQRSQENRLATRQLLNPVTNDAHDVDAGEEFTKEEAATLPRRRLVRTQRHKGPSTLTQILKWTSLLGLSAGSAYGANWFRQEKIKAGYCGVDSDPIFTPPGASGVEELLHQVRPQCVSCPPHATCYRGFRMTCEDEFQKVNHPLSFGGLVPLSAECAPDTEKLQRIQVVADEIVETLRDRTASVECGYTTAPTDGNVGLSASQLRAALLSKKSPAITTEQFSTLFDHAIEEVKHRDEIEVSSGKPTTKLPTNSQTNRLYDHEAGSPGEPGGVKDLFVEDYYHSTSLANISFACSIRHTFYTILARYRVELVGLLTMLTLGLYLKNFFESRSSQRIKVQNLVVRVFDELATMKAKAVDQPDQLEPHLGVSQLRDSILADEFSYATREHLWHEVQAIVESNSNVRATQAEIQGEWLRAWEWVGTVRQITREEKRRELGLEEGDEFVRPVV